MTPLIRAESRRLLATRMWRGLLLAAVLLGGGLVGLMALVGPENFDPPLPGLDTEVGLRAVLGILGYTAFVPAAAGTLAVTSEYRHGTAAVTFLFAPRRGRVLAAKLATHAVVGLAYGIVLAGSAAVALFAVTAARGVPLGLPAPTVLALLARIGLAMTVYLLVGVGVGALLRNQVAALAVVVGYLYLGEPVLMMIPGVSALYPVLPGGATAALTDFTYLADAMSDQTGGDAVHLLPPAGGALLLTAYALVAAAVAVIVPMRRDVT
ncbi:ABC-type transport system involved in multi-copper enzyme maturation, permease component [Micromonospora sediminicola]|uniref:ABC-type transport system involved in multi-copper enzyme maturation, permease component n=1 Tax=Micromonospora sediminicola TaxID=946078 RepID=A0A1A9B2V4_9ACTN|nr:ABC transporter permease subunit [Micromonospora sediminicola]SBT63247.1 ABC-type transport system involved in multi-copper enzyme maturation, permease component [Micromonospora sediminicola]